MALCAHSHSTRARRCLSMPRAEEDDDERDDAEEEEDEDEDADAAEDDDDDEARGARRAAGEIARSDRRAALRRTM